MATKGKFIIFEGLDGAGKKTQANLLKEYLEAKNKEVISTSEPTSDNPISKLIREWLDSKFELKSDEAITLLYIADRYEHLSETIVPALEAGKIVICDRYIPSTLAYEGALFKTDLQWMKNVHAHALKPHIKIFIDTPPEECLERLGEAKTRFETLEIQQKVYDSYKKLISEDKGFNVINGNRTRAEVFEDIKKIIEKPESFLQTKFKNILSRFSK